MQRLLPNDKAGWIDLGVFPFRAYVVIAPLCVITYVTTIGRTYAGRGDFLPSVLEGYVLSFVALVFGAIAQLLLRRRTSALISFVFAIAAVFSAWFTLVSTGRP
jgi:hypothetical protein